MCDYGSESRIALDAYQFVLLFTTGFMFHAGSWLSFHGVCAIQEEWHCFPLPE